MMLVERSAHHVVVLDDGDEPANVSVQLRNAEPCCGLPESSLC